MKVLFILLDSLNRKALGCYGGTTIPTPNFDRIAARGVTFDNHYVGSLPCMPARRDLLTGRLNFLHRSWGPVEPFDRCFTKALAEAGIYSHLISDHYHYWEEGGCGYHNQYSSAEFVRGQERDLWKAMVQPPAERFRELYHPMLSGTERRFPNMVNREFIREESEFPVVQCTQLACEFLDHNHDADNWLLQLELFDPHEPFVSPARFRENLPTDYEGPILDWPIYDKLDLSEAEGAELRANYLALVAMCDHYLGTVLRKFDEHDLWKDTAIVLTTDHGFLLGEQDWWGKNRMPMRDPIVHIPLLVAHPGLASEAGTRRSQLTQCLDVPATLLDIMGAGVPEHYEGRSALSVIEHGHSIREHALFGIFGGALNIADGRHVYMRYPQAPDEDPLFEYTLMPVHPASYFTAAELSSAELRAPFEFTDGMPVLKVPARDDAKRPPMQGGALAEPHNALYDLETDAEQRSPVALPAVEAGMVAAMKRLMERNEAPAELYRRFALTE